MGICFLRMLVLSKVVRATKPRKPTAPPVLVEVRRGETVESVHRGTVVQVGADGEIERAIGDLSKVAHIGANRIDFIAVVRCRRAVPFQLGPR